MGKIFLANFHMAVKKDLNDIVKTHGNITYNIVTYEYFFEIIIIISI